MNIQDLRAKRNTVAAAARTLLDENKEGWNASLTEKYDALLAEIDDIDAGIKRHTDYLDRVAREDMDGKLNDAGGRAAHAAGKPALAELYGRWLRGGDNAITAQEWADIRATMSTTTTTEGGYSVQSDVAATLIEALKAYGGVREVAEVIATSMGNALSFPTSDGTTETGELIAENTTATGADPVFGTVALNVYKFSSKVVAVPFELLQDSQIDIEAFINSRLVTRLGRVTNTYFTTGTGTAQPRGIVTGAGAGKVGTTGQTTTVIFDDLVDLVHSVDPAYRKAAGVGFMMNDSALKVIRKLKDSQNRPVFLPGDAGLSGPMADTVMGYRVTINQDMDAMAANAKSILFGDMSKYMIRDVMAATAFRFTDSAYSKLGQVGFLYWMRSGGNLVDANAVKYYQNSAT